MPFSVGSGDGIAVSKLIIEITKSLRDAAGAKSEYEGLVREFQCASSTLAHLDRLQSCDGADLKTLDSIKYTALSCRQPLEQFLGRLSKYEGALGIYSKQSRVHASTDKIKWALGMKDEVAKLQLYLIAHFTAINTQLALYGFETVHAAQKKSEDFQNHVVGTLEAVQSCLHDIQSNKAAQFKLVEANNSLLARLHTFLSGEITTRWNDLWKMVSTVW